MRSISFIGATALAAIFNSALADWDQKLCNGVGGCLGLTWFEIEGFTCPDGSSLTRQQFAQNLVDMDNGSYDYVPADQFPKTCYRDTPPGPNNKLAVHTTANGLKIYGYITETCTTAAPAAKDCYNSNPNPSAITVCQVTKDFNSPFCKQG